MRYSILSLALLLAIVCVVCPLSADAADHPNITVIMADDLGYGDASAYGEWAVPPPSFSEVTFPNES